MPCAESRATGTTDTGRFPANVIHDGSDEVLAEFAKYGESKSGQPRSDRGTGGIWSESSGVPCGPQHGDTGTAARFFKSCEETDEEWLDRNLHLSVASSAGSSLSLQNQVVASALNRAATWALPVATLTASLCRAPSTNATPKELRLIAESVTEAIPLTVQRCLLGWPLTSNIETRSTVKVAAQREQTGTMTITIDRWKSDGSAAPVIFSITETSTGRGVADSQHARVYYTAKASKDDRNDGLHDYPSTLPTDVTGRKPGSAGQAHARAGVTGDTPRKNHHPTVKPTSLMRYLVRLVTPKGGLVIDPFAGSGTTLIAAYREDCRAIGIELDPDYHKMASHRIEKATAQLRLDL